jgi:hypothetical protein
MSTPNNKFWQGRTTQARTALVVGDYAPQTFSQQLAAGATHPT